MSASARSRKRNNDEVRHFVERLAGVFVATGFPRMPARVFSALLATDSGALTTAELAKLLRVSPAAISGAVKYLTQQNLASREWEPGSRRERYRLHDDVWYEAIAKREPLLDRWTDSLVEGVEVLGPGTPAGARMVETLAFWEFMAAELPRLLDRWRTRRAKLQRGSPSKIH
jgi:DNA-binding transcriptional regulator GbsR (MarR family)